MDDGTVDDRVFGTEPQGIGDFAGLDQPPESHAAGDAVQYSLVVSQVSPQHFGIGETRTDAGGVDAGTGQILAGGAHGTDHRVLGDDVRTGIRHRLFSQRRTHVDRRRTRLHDRHQQARQLGRTDHVDLQRALQAFGGHGSAGVFEHQPGVVDDAQTRRRADLPEQRFAVLLRPGGIAQIDLQLLDLRQRRGCTGDIDDPPALLQKQRAGSVADALAATGDDQRILRLLGHNNSRIL